MQVICMATVSVPTTAGGTPLLTAAQVADGIQRGMTCLIINPSVDIVIVDGTALGTVANGAVVMPAGVATPFDHRSGIPLAISTSGTATVKVTIGCGP